MGEYDLQKAFVKEPHQWLSQEIEVCRVAGELMVWREGWLTERGTECWRAGSV